MVNLDSVYIYKAIVLSNYDGDTITVNLDYGFKRYEMDVKIRLYGINTPEMRGESKALGKVAKDRVGSLIPKGTVIYCKSKLDKLGSFKRKLMVVYYLDSEGNIQNLNYNLIKENLAVLKYVDSIEEIM